MGRAKIPITKVEDTRKRQNIFSRRKNGIMKKAKELAILCDAKMCLVMFSPSGKLEVCDGENSVVEDVILKFLKLPSQERRKRKFESLEVLKKTFQKLGHNVKIDEFSAANPQKNEWLQLQNELARTQNKVLNIKRKTWYFEDETYQINNLDSNQATNAEERLTEALGRMRMRKEALRMGRLTPTEGSEMLYHNNVCFASTPECAEQSQPTSLLPTHGRVSMVHEGHASGFSQGVLPCSQNLQLYHNNTCFGSTPGCAEQSQLTFSLPTDGRVSMVHKGPALGISQRDVKCAANASVPLPSPFMYNFKQANMENRSSQLAAFSDPLNRHGLSMPLEYQGSSSHPNCQYNHSVVTEKEVCQPETSADYQYTCSVVTEKEVCQPETSLQRTTVDDWQVCQPETSVQGSTLDDWQVCQPETSVQGTTVNDWLLVDDSLLVDDWLLEQCQCLGPL